MFGPAMPDTQDPTVVITAPNDGAVYPVGSDFTIVVDAQDDVEVANVELFVNDVSVGSNSSPPYEWPAMGIPEGEHEFYAIATDGWGNETTSASITVYATQDGTSGGDGDGDSGGDGDGDSGGDGDGDGDGDSGGTTDEPYPGNAFPPGFGEGDSEAGCACNTRNSLPTGASLMLLLLGAPLLRRRR